MGLNVNTNIGSLRAQRNLNINAKSIDNSIAKMSSGLRINQSSDDAAGLAISEHLKAQIRGLSVCTRNASDGISLVQTAEGVLGTVHGMLIRMRELALQSATGTYGDGERAYLQQEFGSAISEIDRIATRTEFNGQLLLNGDMATGLSIQVGLHSSVDDRINIAIPPALASQLGLESAAAPSLAAQDIASMTAAQMCLAVIDQAISDVSGIRGGLGATQNRLENTIDNIMIQRTNLSAADSRVRDADIAAEASELTRVEILTNAATAMIAQANQMPRLALQLIGQG